MRLKVYCYVDVPSQDEIVEIPDDEWDSLTEKAKEDRLDDEAREFMGNCVDFGALIVSESEDTESQSRKCPECGAPLASNCYSGEKCSKCNYWFCY